MLQGSWLLVLGALMIGGWFASRVAASSESLGDIALAATGQRAAGVAELEAWSQANPDARDARRALAIAYLETGDFAKALDGFRSLSCVAGNHNLSII